MSIINDMLRELDRRQAGADPQRRAPHAEASPSLGAEWFWRTIAALLLIAAAWAVWVVYQLQPRSVVTELAYRSADNLRCRGLIAAAPLVDPAPAVEQSGAAAPSLALRLALTIDTQGAGKTASPATE
jgi:hypothetical protein